MKNRQPSTPAFVLTSLSFADNENKTVQKQHRKSIPESQSSSIVTFDYCLPPEEFNHTDLMEVEHTV